MVNTQTGDKETENAEMARVKARIYDLLAGIFTHLPDQPFVGMIRGDDLKHVLDSLSDLESAKSDSGIACIHSYGSAIKTRPTEEVLKELSVDPKRILRGTGHPDLKPPMRVCIRRIKRLENLS